MLLFNQSMKRDQFWILFILCIVAPLMLGCDAVMFVFSCMSGGWQIKPPRRNGNQKDVCSESSTDTL